ncbi:unnamed protein product, partial [Choristocarpus tenellus]
ADGNIGAGSDGIGGVGVELGGRGRSGSAGGGAAAEREGDETIPPDTEVLSRFWEVGDGKPVYLPIPLAPHLSGVASAAPSVTPTSTWGSFGHRRGDSNASSSSVGGNGMKVELGEGGPT